MSGGPSRSRSPRSSSCYTGHRPSPRRRGRDRRVSVGTSSADRPLWTTVDLVGPVVEMRGGAATSRGSPSPDRPLAAARKNALGRCAHRAGSDTERFGAIRRHTGHDRRTAWRRDEGELVGHVPSRCPRRRSRRPRRRARRHRGYARRRPRARRPGHAHAGAAGASTRVRAHGQPDRLHARVRHRRRRVRRAERDRLATELLFSQQRAVVGKRYYGGDGLTARPALPRDVRRRLRTR